MFKVSTSLEHACLQSHGPKK